MMDSDRLFMLSLENGQIPNMYFRHRDHLRAAWCYVQQRGLDVAVESMKQTIRHFAASHGHSDKFHFTLTELWVRLVGAHVIGHDHLPFDKFIVEHDQLLDKNLPLKFYSDELLFSDRARAQWVDPDIQALPKPCQPEA